MKVFRPGVFDILHSGHVACIADAAKQGDYLIVGVQDDREVKAQKGSAPTKPLHERMAIVAALRGVDEVISYRSSDLSILLETLGIDVLAVGDDYGASPGQATTLEFCRSSGVVVHRTARTSGVSSSAIKAFWLARAGNTMLGSANQAAETAREVELMASYIKPLDSVLDLGAGSGRLAMPLALRCRSMTCVDFAPQLLSQIVGCETIEADVASFCRGSYDVIIASGIFPYLSDSEAWQVAVNCWTMLRPGGFLLVRTSVGTHGRIDVANQFSDTLRALYSAVYRSAAELDVVLAGFSKVSEMTLYANHPDTHVAFVVYAK